MKTKVRKMLSVILPTVCICCCTFGSAGASALPESVPVSQAHSYTEQVTKVYDKGEEAGELTLRFYDTAPNVAYMGMDTYSRYMKNQPLTLQDNGDGTWTMLNAVGAQLHCDPEAGTIIVPDWNRFFDWVLLFENDLENVEDYYVDFSYFKEVEYLDEPQIVTLDLKKYGIDIYTDEEDIYLPVSILNIIMTDVSSFLSMMLAYNGENLYMRDCIASSVPVEEYYTSERLQAEIQGEARPQDLIKECYAELCFTLDNFYGHPGRGVLDAALDEKGLDEALRQLGEEGEVLRSGLMSPDLTEYISALVQLFMVYLDDGHTYSISRNELAELAEVYPELTNRLYEDYCTYLTQSTVTMQMFEQDNIPLQRWLLWGDKPYREYGSTAIIRIDSLAPDIKAWNSFYKGESEMPEDEYAALIMGLQRAQENPEIKNVIIDQTCGGGGYDWILAAIMAMTTGVTEFNEIHRTTGQRMILKFEVDTNMDGVIDERDKEPCYDLNYGVLVTRYAFSTSNTFPVYMRKGGAVIIGEPANGGSCYIQAACDSEGLCYNISGPYMTCDDQWNSVEGGGSIDLPVDIVRSETVTALLSLMGLQESLPFFNNFYDEASLDAMMNDWFQNREAGEAEDVTASAEAG